MVWDATGAAEERHKMAAWKRGPSPSGRRAGPGRSGDPLPLRGHQHWKSDHNAAAPRRLGRCQKGKRARSRPETHPRTKKPQPPLLPDAAPQRRPRPEEQPPRPGTSARLKGAERAAGATALRAGAAGSRGSRARLKQLGRSGEPSPFIQQNQRSAGRAGLSPGAAALRSPRDTAEGRLCPPKPPVCLSSGTFEGKTNISEG